MTDAPTSLRSITLPRGFRAAGGTCGIKPSGKPDLALIVADHPGPVAGVFTTNKVLGAPVIVSQRHLQASHGIGQAMICNSGCSNVCTGERGERDAQTMCQRVAEQVGCPAEQVLVCSTGVIGPLLPMAKIEKGIAKVFPHLERGEKADAVAARAILTTDLVPKAAQRTVELAGQTVHLGGIAKGSGMIAPNMATMLAFVTTDAAITPPLLQQALAQATRQSFNRISVDHDTSTSDSAMVMASGIADHPVIDAEDAAYARFLEVLTDLCRDLAYQIVCDGEGATRVFRVRVTGCATEEDADRVGHCVVGSPLVKTAVHGGDPNWGRIMAAAGRSGAALNPRLARLDIGGIRVFDAGRPLPQDEPILKRLEAAMAEKEVLFEIDLGLGQGSAEWLGCDLSREYVTINADYTT